MKGPGASPGMWELLSVSDHTVHGRCRTHGHQKGLQPILAQSLQFTDAPAKAQRAVILSRSQSLSRTDLGSELLGCASSIAINWCPCCHCLAKIVKIFFSHLSSWGVIVQFLKIPQLQQAFPTPGCPSCTDTPTFIRKDPPTSQLWTPRAARLRGLRGLGASFPCSLPRLQGLSTGSPDLETGRGTG